MKSYQLIHQLISLVEELEAENHAREVSIQDFTGFLLNKVGDPSGNNINNEVRFGNSDTTALDIAYQLDNNISRMFVFMSRYAKSYIKKALEGTPLQTTEDFTALAILLTHNHLSKSELISHNLQEKTSGTEVIRRLIASGLVRQWDDVKDKRSKHIAITAEGKGLLYSVFEHTSYVGKIITGKLTVAEKFTLQYLLQKLESFHLEHYEKKTILNKEDLKKIASEVIPA
ncbi:MULTISPECIES: winged helix DNA-binding protein [unclassified Mucilaginibacter]|uniref:MarR family winged helix-turn-helix transcriptional regulator n=1 Tax=unclassified Mucilaginibacter TaxID=2617802 RepID=UPI002AC9D38E|nr:MULTISPECIES: winged helix DNA-binding protein [unclassified Mucilaginibacter]MEB0260107.1 winged helix DNA-binding protein [Mucilaginibacter sp. 10I4]MEB0279171.1 winged helix DNA-binding protein [Mucilaginibacter sp. 10B2]MEB0301572.1 winged helix DNA-binding protein [Mucilaginibacter sp. 5C4]WPX22350.1 winged helix DNA-binding protein [Mucilaginibacter sp. 5C4]